MTSLNIIRNLLVMAATVAALGVGCTPKKAENASEGKISNVYVLASDSRDANKLVFLPMVTLIKGTDTLTSAAPDFPNNYLELGKYEKGNYTITFQNIYGQKVSQQFAVTGAGTDTVKVYLDKGIYPKNGNTSRIDKLQKGESFTIHLTSMGCSHFRKDSLILYYRDKNIRAYNGVKDKPLSQKQIKAVRDFELQAKLMKDGGCTTTDRYHISYKDEVLEFTDTTCKWEGLKLLSKVLFGVENKVNEI